MLDIGGRQSSTKYIIQTGSSDPDEPTNLMTDSLIGIYRCSALDFEKSIGTQKAIEEFKKMIYFKHVFLVGASKEQI